MSRERGSSHRVVRPHDVPDGCVVSVFRVPPEVAGQRVDVFLQGQLRRTSRTRTKAILRASAYDADGRRLRPGMRVLPEQRIVLWRPPWDETPVPRELPVIYEDEHLLAVNKPAQVPVHPTARYHHNTVIMLLKAERPDAFLSLGHRIDRETSGVLLVSKTPTCDRALKRMLEQRDAVEKRYLALTWGVPEHPETTPRCAAEPGARFRFEQAMELDLHSPLRVKMRASNEPTALHAATRFAVEGVRRSRRGRTYARVACDLETGRQHQIRVHLATLGAPIVGDKLYGPDERLFARAADQELTAADLALLELSRHALHAHRMALPHPVTRQPLEIVAPCPEDLAAFWEDLEPG
jgi:23S rRNA pseudouridine1911/1915/1917 synthase